MEADLLMRCSDTETTGRNSRGDRGEAIRAHTIIAT
jgi:hypothetical protein